MRQLTGFFILVLSLLAPAGAWAETSKYTVRPLDEMALAQKKDLVDAAINQTLIEGFEIFSKQSFQVELVGEESFSLINGKGTAANSEGINVDMCAAVIVPSEKSSSAYPLPTIGSWEWEALSCADVLGVGFLPDKSSNYPKAVVLYSASSPNAESKPAIVLAWNKKAARYQIDEASSKLADKASDRTIKGIVSILGKK